MAKPSFINLWNSYPRYTHTDPACSGPWANQCAIRVSIALCGERTLPVNSSTYNLGPLCAHGHARGAESLAHWLSKKRQLSPPKTYTNSVADRAILRGKTGIIFFKDCYQTNTDRAGQPTGDHIDLWNRGLTKSGDLSSSAKEIWFWELL